MRLEPCAGKLASTVLRGGSDGNITSLPDSTARNGSDALFGGVLDYKQFRKLFPATRHLQRYSSEQRANLRASHRQGYLQRQRIGEYFYTHELCGDVGFDTAKSATERAYRIYLSQFGDIADLQ